MSNIIVDYQAYKVMFWKNMSNANEGTCLNFSFSEIEKGFRASLSEWTILCNHMLVLYSFFFFLFSLSMFILALDFVYKNESLNILESNTKYMENEAKNYNYFNVRKYVTSDRWPGKNILSILHFNI